MGRGHGLVGDSIRVMSTKALAQRVGIHQQRMVRPSTIRIMDTDGAKRFIARVLTYGTVDDYSTMFGAGCFTESMAKRLPRITWAHDWAEPIGRWSLHEDTDDHLDLMGELDDFDAVPRARQAYAQLRSGTIDQFSVGFLPEADEMVDPAEVGGRKGIYRFTKGRLDEAALVLVGAVPGTELLAVRSAQRGRRLVQRTVYVPLAEAESVMQQLGLGQVTYDGALTALTNAAVELDADPETDEPETDAEPESGPTEEEAAAAALAEQEAADAAAAAEAEAAQLAADEQAAAAALAAEEAAELERLDAEAADALELVGKL